MKIRKETIKRMIDFINNEDEQGGLWLPNIQRYFVWTESQIEKLFDSILREYPIGNFLIWKTKDAIKMRRFIDNYRDGIKLTDFYIPKNEKTKFLVLDGQQRLQSLFIALKGSYNGKELYFNVLSGNNNDIEDIKYEFKFMENNNNEPKWVKVKDIIYNYNDYDEIAEDIISEIENITKEEKKLIRKNILKLLKRFRDDEIIAYTELDSVDNPNLYTLDDVVEVFIRANSGGTPLNKSDLMFSLLTSNWEEIEEDLEEFLQNLNRNSFNFTRDFVLKTSLVLIGTGAKYDVNKFRNENNIKKLKEEWTSIKSSISKVVDFLNSYTFIRHDKALPSYIALIPIIYFIHKHPDKWEYLNKNKLSLWISKVLLTGAFSGSSDSIIDAVINIIGKEKDFNFNSINDEILKRGRNIYLTKDNILELKYGNRKIYLVFSLLYGNIDFEPLYDGNLPHIDHIFPTSLLKREKVLNPETRRKQIKYPKEVRNQIANLMLLSRDENVFEKNNKTPEEWFESKSEEYFDIHLIPKNKELLKIENFDRFIEERKKLIITKLEDLGLLDSKKNEPS